MNTKELIAACRDTADALGDANLRISTTKFDSRSVSDLLWAAAAALEAKCSCGKAGAECSGDRIQGRKDEELAERERLEKLFAERERLERLFEEARQIADRRAWDETSRTMADSCGQEANDE